MNECFLNTKITLNRSLLCKKKYKNNKIYNNKYKYYLYNDS